jgi:hypothetical protein
VTASAEDFIYNVAAVYDGTGIVTVTGIAQGVSNIQIHMYNGTSGWDSLIRNPADGSFSKNIPTGELGPGTYIVEFTAYRISDGGAEYDSATFTVQGG